MRIILGLMGAAGSGKSTVTAHLVERYGAVRYSFADPLKDMVARAFDLSPEQVRGTQAQKEAVDPRYNVSPRWLLQRIGTEGCRATFGESFWTDQTLERIEKGQATLAVIEDVRFVNEAEAIRRVRRDGWAAEGFVWRLECPDRQSSADTTHASEAEYLRAPHDAVITARMSPGSQLLKDAIDRQINATPAIIRALRFGA